MNDHQELELPEELAVAVIGMSGRFPGADNVSQFWQNLASGTESITRFDAAQLLAKGVDPAMLDNEGFVKAGSFIQDIENFD
ncbi:MAG: hypothetical protein HRT35_34610, partial [Algicola sp.]|nr:hypothetical protein [Algicola sp.]